MHEVDKVEMILKGSLDSIPSPSPSVTIQIMAGKVCLRCKGKILLGVDITQQCFALLKFGLSEKHTKFEKKSSSWF